MVEGARNGVLKRPLDNCFCLCSLNSNVDLYVVCDSRVTQVWHEECAPCDVWTGVEGLFGSGEFRMPAWPRFQNNLFPTLGIHGNVCTLVCVCIRLCKCTSPLFYITEPALSYPRSGHNKCPQASTNYDCVSCHLVYHHVIFSS